MTKERFERIAKESLVILESPTMDEDGEFPMEIYGIDKLYDKLFVEPYKTMISKDFLGCIRNDVSDLITLCEWKKVEPSEAYLKMLKTDLKELNKLLEIKK